MQTIGMTEVLYMDDSYLAETEAKIISRNLIDNTWIVQLDRTVFYPKGGGLLSDSGWLVHDGKEYNVPEVYKFKGEVYHVIDEKPPEVGSSIVARIDWDRRYAMMRYHTAAHVLASRFYKIGAKITGNQITPERARFDFNLPEFNRDTIEELVRETNTYLGQDIPVEVFYMKREDVLNNPELIKLAEASPPDVEVLRIVKIGDVDIQADGGPHVKNLREVPPIKILKMENKGRNNRRVYFVFDE